ncbi:liver stage antigen-1, putative [Perkinsus marinus ATCC 50983]|uniref:Liver stage antigen-1, putative n=1 Tax=Perkinsus marinus (strain ATCC 50983 / TXsc) TaxID=423536 RepID=C5LQK3_PERM5|nr:liver stage antigen-1, putative [Perkinsus marinus ATCC 50983]EER00988.1 liver stage antigen-1, putative [Perkinsus marinus ATCC 50983]|eukprot:XP_002768270.1 liver stage antigen-1, putative [Perkinsus marinus ATCC 50983]
MAVQTLLEVVSRRAMGTQTPTGRHSVSATCSVQTEQKLAVHAEMQVDGSTRDDLAHSAVIEELQSRSETQLSELQAKNTKLRDLQRAKSSLELKIRQLESERDQLQASRKDLSNQLKTADRKMKALGSANRDIQASMEKSTKEHISVIMAMQNEIAELEKQVKELGEKLAEKTEEHIATQRVVDMFKVEVRKWQGEARKVQQRQVQLVSCSRCITFTKLEKAYTALRKEHELEQERYAAAFKTREEMKDKFRNYVSPDREGQLLREIENLNAMHEVDQRCLRKEIAQLKQERDRMRGQHAEESHRSSKLMSDLQDSIDGVLPQKTVSSEADSWLVEQLDSAVEEGLVERGGPVSGSQAQQHSSEVSELRAETAKLKSELDFTKERCEQESENARMYTSLLEVDFLSKFCRAGWMLLRTPSWRRNGID